MAFKSGFSHSLGSVILLVVGAVLVEYLKPSFPGIIRPLEWFADRLAGAIQTTLGISVAPQIFGPLIILFVLSFVWGTLYHFARHGRR